MTGKLLNRMTQKSNNHGGFRDGSGRPKNDRNITLSVRITQEAMDKLNESTNNKSEFIDNLIKINTTMPITNLSKSIRTVEHFYIANNQRCLDYAVLFTKNGEERFVGYTKINTLSAVVGEIEDYTDINRRYEQNSEMPSWIKEAIE